MGDCGLACSDKSLSGAGPETSTLEMFGLYDSLFSKLPASLSHLLTQPSRGLKKVDQDETSHRGLADIQLKVMDNVDAMLGYWDKDLRCRAANAAYKVWFGKTRDKILGRHIEELLGPLFELNLPHIRAALEGEVQVFEREIPVPLGNVRHSLASYYPDIVNGKVVGFSVHVADVTRMKQLEHELRAAKTQAETMATHDFLTGLPNRVLLEETVSRAIERAKFHDNLVGVAIVDVDEFKQINDSFGHETGDEFLKEIARRLKRVLRITDSVIRLGGDEFVIVACDVKDAHELRLAMNRIIGSVSRPWNYQTAILNPSLSCGVASFPNDGAGVRALLAAADAAMYRAKREGKKRVLFAESNTSN